MAAASIAQVHQAIVPRQGVVAIKVLRPRIEKKLAKEMARAALPGVVDRALLAALAPA